MKKYSRLASIEEKRNRRKAYVLIALTALTLILLFRVGLPTMAKFAGFLIDLGKSGSPPDKNDTTPPAPPRINTLPEATSDLKVTISGSTEPGATVTLFLNGKNEEIIAGSDGTFSLTFTLLDGENTVEAIAKDTTGNESLKSETYKIVFDDKPPSLEITSPSDGSSFYGSGQRQVSIEGKTEGDSSLTINERVIAVDDDGTFTFATTLSEGSNLFTIKASDKAGNSTEKSLTLHYSP